MSIVQSKEFFINMKEKDIPKWNDFLPYEDQERSVKQFWRNELDKILNGININGHFIHPWLYFHVNFWKMYYDTEDDRIPITSHFRDNEWYFAECLQKAKEERLGLLLYGTRRFGKALKNTEMVYTPLRKKPIGEIKQWDQIYDDSGKLVKVIGVYPQGKIKTYEITFEDSRKIVCCPEHIWRVIINGKKHDYNTEELVKIKNGYNSFNNSVDDIYIPLPEAIDFAPRYLKIEPFSYGVHFGNYIMGNDDEQPYRMDSTYEYSSIEQKRFFIDGFFKSTIGFESGYDEINIKNSDLSAISFICRMFWSSGYYCKYEDKKLTITSNIDKVKIKSIKPHKKEECTCIEVDNESKLFLTTDYIITHNTAILSSHTGWRATVTKGLDHSIVGFSEDDIAQMANYMSFGLDNVPPYFKIYRPNNDWDKGVVLGIRDASNIVDVHARITITNIDGGKKKATQKTAGGTPGSFKLDEIGKGECKGSWNAARPSLKSGWGFRDTPILSGTSNPDYLSKDAQDLLNNPRAYDLYDGCWDVLDKLIPDNERTYRRRIFSMFVPGQLAYHLSIKKEITYGEFLGVNDDKYLNKIKFHLTDFKSTNERLDNILKVAKDSGDKKNFLSETVFQPKDPTDCFIGVNTNSFPVQEGSFHLAKMKEEGREGMFIDLFRDDKNNVLYKQSDKPIAPFPFGGGIWDAPVIMYEPPPKFSSYGDFIYVCGMDPYKQKQANTQSMGSFYVFKRYVGLNDKYADQIVASYTSRPPKIETFCRTCEMLQDAYGAVCLMENADLMYEIYLSGKQREFLLLENGEDLAMKTISGSARQNNKFGLSPTTKNQEYLLGLVNDYLWDQDWSTEGILGIYRIKDWELLEEIISWSPSGNFDRILSFGHALALGRYYAALGRYPKSEEQKKREEEARTRTNKIDRRQSAFSNRRMSAFSGRR